MLRKTSFIITFCVMATFLIGAKKYISSNGWNLKIEPPMWDTLRVSASSMFVRAGEAEEPSLIKLKDNGSGSVGVYAHGFDAAVEEAMYFTAQLPHRYKLGTDLKPHLHWVPTNTNTGSARWCIEYTLALPGDDFGNTSIICTNDPADGTAGKHEDLTFTAISGTGITALGINIVGRVYRDADDAADTYDTTAALLFLDFHFQIDYPGSHTEFTK